METFLIITFLIAVWALLRTFRKTGTIEDNKIKNKDGEVIYKVED